MWNRHTTASKKIIKLKLVDHFCFKVFLNVEEFPYNSQMLFLLFARLSYQAPVQSHLSTQNSGKPYIPAFHLTNLQTRTRRATACLNGGKFQSMRQRSCRSSIYVRCARDLGAITRQRSCTLFLFRCDYIYTKLLSIKAFQIPNCLSRTKNTSASTKSICVERIW